MGKYTKKDRIKFAEDMYDLDAKVYEVLGSALGRVFNTGKERTIEDVLDLMSTSDGQYLLRNELALIGNMARTLNDHKERHFFMIEYDRLLKLMNDMLDDIMNTDIIDEDRAKLSHCRLSDRFEDKDHLIITIERSYGCGGKAIGFGVADELRINYYDDQVFQEMVKRLRAEHDHLKDRGNYSYGHGYHLDTPTGSDYTYTYTEPSFVPEKKHRNLSERIEDLNRYHGLPKRDAMFFIQSQILCDMAKLNDFLIMGHCAHAILTKNKIPHISIMLTAPYERRVQRVMQQNKDMTSKRAHALVKEQDVSYQKYYKFYTGLDWDDASQYDISFNCSAYGIKETQDMILKILKHNLLK